MASEAVEKVINTPEVLEMILLNLNDIRTLLLSQRACRAFKDTIASSPKLQRALCFKRDPALMRSPARPTLDQANKLFIYVMKSVITPEGHYFYIYDKLSDADTMELEWIGELPTKEEPATGSWRKMHTWRGKTRRYHLGITWKREEDDVKAVVKFVRLPVELQQACLGDLVDWAVERISEAA